MGGLCSRAVHESVEEPSLKLAEPGPSSIVNGNHSTTTATAQIEILKPVSPEDDSDGTASRDDDDGKKEKIKLSRVLSNKARNVTTVAAKKGAAKVSEVGSLLGRAGTAGFGIAVEALDTFGSSITNISSGFGGGVPKGNKIDILAFEVANTVVRGFNLMQSLSEDSLRILKKEILPSEGVQRLISKDSDELWLIAAADKRQELKTFASEVVRFGNHCRDPQWHQLDRVFRRLGTEIQVPHQTNDQAEAEMQELMSLAQNTAELYHELHALDRFQNDVRRKMEEEELASAPPKGDSLALLKSDLKCQQKHVKLLKKGSLWSRVLEEVMEKLVDIVYFLHQKISEAFGGPNDVISLKVSDSQGLGALGLALHYANIINQIDTLVSRPNSVPPNTRDNLYQGLPPSIKANLRAALGATSSAEELTAAQIKEEMEKTLDWLVPIASNTTKVHHGFGWVGEWASAGTVDRKPYDLSLVQTLHHADRTVTDKYILDLLVLLNLLIIRVKSKANTSPHKSPFRSPVKKTTATSICLSSPSPSPSSSPPPPPIDDHHHQLHQENEQLQQQQQEQQQEQRPSSPFSKEDEEMLAVVSGRKKLTPGISKSQEFTSKAKSKELTSMKLSKSHSHSPLLESTITSRRCSRKDGVPVYLRRSIPPLEVDIERIKALDKMDRVDTLSTCGPSTV